MNVAGGGCGRKLLLPEAGDTGWAWTCPLAGAGGAASAGLLASAGFASAGFSCAASKKG